MVEVEKMGSPEGGGGGGIFRGKSRPCLNLFCVCRIHIELMCRINGLARFMSRGKTRLRRSWVQEELFMWWLGDLLILEIWREDLLDEAGGHVVDVSSRPWEKQGMETV